MAGRISRLVLGLGLPLATAGMVAASAPQPSRCHPPSVLARALAAEHGLPGLAAVTVHRDRIVDEIYTGWADVAAERPVDRGTAFRLASLSKPLTAGAILQLAKQGRLSLDRPAASLLPFLADGTAAGLRAITVRHLLQHSGGWDAAETLDPMTRGRAVALAQGLDRPPGCRDVASFMLGHPLQHPPGTRYAYSNFGYCLLGLIVEEVSGGSYEDFVRQEVLAPQGAVMAVGSAVGGEARYYRRSLWGRRVLLQAPPAGAVADFTLEAMAANGGWAVVAAISGAVLLTMAATWVLRHHLGTIVAGAFGVVVLTTALLPVGTIPAGVVHDQAGGPRADLPPIVHIILDEQIGIEGLPGDIPGGEELRRDLRAFYEQRGFTVFGGAYSQYEATADTLPNLLNGRLASEIFVHVHNSGGPKRLHANAWFSKLSGAGYRIRVYQSDYLDFCGTDGAAVDYYLYPSNSVQPLSSVPIPAAMKVSLIFVPLLNESLAFRVGVAILRPILDPDQLTRVRQTFWFGSLSALPVTDRLAADLRAPRGTVFFAHLLLPHGSYIYDDECRPRPDPATWLRHSDPTVPPPLRNTPASRAQRYLVYLEQVRCLHRRLAALFAELDALDPRGEATVLVHGDHGSRISLLAPASERTDQLSAADLIDIFSTLFAVRAPGLTPGYDGRMRSLHGLFAAMLLQQPTVDDESGEVVFLRPDNPAIGDSLRPWPMPPFGR